MSFTLAIVGRPNVGKSSLFNRIAGRRIAIVHDTPGVTRDRRVADAVFDGMELRLIDTAGFEDVPEFLDAPVFQDKRVQPVPLSAPPRATSATTTKKRRENQALRIRLRPFAVSCAGTSGRRPQDP